MAAVRVDIGEELIEQIARRAAQLLAEHAEPAKAEPDGYLDVNGAAEFLACPKSRIDSLASSAVFPTTTMPRGFSSTAASCASSCAREARGGRDGLSVGVDRSLRLRGMPANARDKARADAERAQRQYERDLDKARGARRKSFERAQKVGLSLREIGESVGLHHSRVAEIIRGE